MHYQDTPDNAMYQLITLSDRLIMHYQTIIRPLSDHYQTIIKLHDNGYQIITRAA